MHRSSDDQGIRRGVSLHRRPGANHGREQRVQPRILRGKSFLWRVHRSGHQPANRRRMCLCSRRTRQQHGTRSGQSCALPLLCHFGKRLITELKFN